MKTFDVFISYSSRQKNIADAICHVLEEHNIKCWMAPRDIPVGEKYAAVITRAIKESKLVVLVFSEMSAVSPWVESEINIAFSNRKPILPYKVDDAKLSDYDEFYLMLNNRHWIESVPDFRTRFDELLETAANLLKTNTTKSKHNTFTPTIQEEKETTEKPISTIPDSDTKPHTKQYNDNEDETRQSATNEKHGLINAVCIADCVLSLFSLMAAASGKEGPWTVFLLIRMGCVVPLIFNSIKGSIVMLIAGFIFAMYISAEFSKSGGFSMCFILGVTAIVYALLLSLRKNGMSAWTMMMSKK